MTYKINEHRLPLTQFEKKKKKLRVQIKQITI